MALSDTPIMNKNIEKLEYFKTQKKAGTKSLNSYWENIYNAQYDRIGKEDFVFDGRKTIFESWKRRYVYYSDKNCQLFVFLRQFSHYCK